MADSNNIRFITKPKTGGKKPYRHNKRNNGDKSKYNKQTSQKFVSNYKEKQHHRQLSKNNNNRRFKNRGKFHNWRYRSYYNPKSFYNRNLRRKNYSGFNRSRSFYLYSLNRWSKRPVRSVYYRKARYNFNYNLFFLESNRAETGIFEPKQTSNFRKFYRRLLKRYKKRLKLKPLLSEFSVYRSEKGPIRFMKLYPRLKHSLKNRRKKPSPLSRRGKYLIAKRKLKKFLREKKGRRNNLKKAKRTSLASRLDIKKFFNTKLNPKPGSESLAVSSTLKQKLFRACIGHLIRKGRKSWAENVVSKVFFLLKKRFKAKPDQFLWNALFKLRPILGLRPKKRGGVIYKVPFLLKDTKQWSTSVFWLVTNARQRLTGGSLTNSLFEEIVDVIQAKPFSALKKKDEMHKIALANRPFLR